MPDRIVARIPQKVRWWFAAGFVLAVSLGLVAAIGIAVSQRGEIASLRAAEVAEEEAERKAEGTAAVVSCLRGVYDVPDFLAALDGLDVVLANQIEAIEEALREDPAGPLAAGRRERLRRAMRARDGLERLISGEDGQGGIVRQRTTLRECRRIARERDVDFEPLVKQASNR